MPIRAYEEKKLTGRRVSRLTGDWGLGGSRPWGVHGGMQKKLTGDTNLGLLGLKVPLSAYKEKGLTGRRVFLGFIGLEGAYTC